MIKKKKTPNEWPLRILLLVSISLVLIVGYYVMEAFLPSSFVEPTYGPSLFGRRFSMLAFVYNALFVAILLIAAFFLQRLYDQKLAKMRSKKSTTKRSGVVVGTGRSQYKGRTNLYRSVSLILITILIGVFGTLTSKPSDALSTSASTIKLVDISYSKISGVHSPTGSTRYTNAKKDSDGKLIDTMQGGTSDGTYLYFAYESPVAGGVIAKFDMSGKLLKKSTIYKPSQIGHANALAYNSRIKKLALSVWRPDAKTSNKDKVAYVDPTTLKITSYATVQPSATVTNICYEPTADRYEANTRLYDGNLQVIKTGVYSLSETLLKQYNDKDSLGQGITCDANRIYVIRYYPNKTRPHTHLYVFDWSGTLTAVYNIKGLKDEAENVFVVAGKMYMGVNNGTTYLGHTADNKNDYFVRLNGVPLSVTPNVSTN